MDATALSTFIPLASAAIGAGATYLWQTLGDRRTERAVRAQTDARLAELYSVVRSLHKSAELGAATTATLQRIVTSLDDMQIAMAFRNDPRRLMLLGQIRVRCAYMMHASSDKNSDDTPDSEGRALQDSAEGLILLILQTMSKSPVQLAALTDAAKLGFRDLTRVQQLLDKQKEHTEI